MDPEHITAVQAVVDRVTSYQEGATEGTIEESLREAFTQTDVELDDQQVAALVEAIEKTDEPVDVASVLG